jgi:dienelactone hydrolase
MYFVRAFVALTALAISGCQLKQPGTDGMAQRQGAVSALLRDGWTQTASLTPASLSEKLKLFEEGRWTLEVAGAPSCGVDVYHYEYNSVDGKGAAVTASGALMVPTGSDLKCEGHRPIILGLHGTVADKPYNLADFSGENPASVRALAWAGVYASQGYTVVAPNYTGLDTSTASYQSYLHAAQQTEDVLRALAAARELLPQVADSPSDKLFLVGYSQGGWLAMATHREMEARGLNLTASVPMSGPYALTALADDVFAGRPVQGSTLFFPLIVRAYQNAYGDLYTAPSELFSAGFADGVATLLPSHTPLATLVQDGQLPETALFPFPSATPPGVSASVRHALESDSPAKEPARFASIYAAGFGTSFLINEGFRIDYLEDMQANPDGAWSMKGDGEPPQTSANPFRRAIMRNDLRGWTPKAHMMMCGGPGDAAAPFRYGGEFMMRYWSDPRRAPRPGVVSLLDIEAPIAASDAFEALKADFQARKGPYMRDTKAPAWVDAYHQLLLPRYCYTAARQYFDALR